MLYMCIVWRLVGLVGIEAGTYFMSQSRQVQFRQITGNRIDRNICHCVAFVSVLECVHQQHSAG